MLNDGRSAMDTKDKLKVERRAHVRVPGPFEGAWSGGSHCRITNLSVLGCYVECLAPQEKGFRTSVEIALPREGRILVGAEIIYKETGMGFAVRFMDLNAEIHTMLERTVSPVLISPTARVM
jgi:hypothetical protein